MLFKLTTGSTCLSREGETVVSSSQTLEMLVQMDGGSVGLKSFNAIGPAVAARWVEGEKKDLKMLKIKKKEGKEMPNKRKQSPVYSPALQGSFAGR